MAQIARILLVVLLNLSLLAGSASAECAWVLWGFNLPAGWLTLKGFPKHEECTKAAVQYNSNAEQEGADLARAKSGVYYACLPDTVDPRGPKAK